MAPLSLEGIYHDHPFFAESQKEKKLFQANIITLRMIMVCLLKYENPKIVVSSKHPHPRHYSAQRRDDLESTAFEKSTRWRDATNRFCIMYFLCICICTLYY